MGSRVLLTALAALTLGCSSGERRFPLRDPLWQDGDLRIVSVPCEARPSEKDPKHVACAPRPYVSPLAWDGIDNSVFRPLAKVFAVDPPREPVNVNALDEVPDSAWFTNRIGRKKPSIEELLRGACVSEEILDADAAAPASLVIDQGKPNGASKGFRIKVAGRRKYMMKTDVKEQPERPSAASAIGAAIYHAVGFFTSCEQIVYVDPRSLKLTPGLVATDNSGITKPFDDKALADVLDGATHRGDRVRLQASAWLPGYLIGPFRYERTRGDDPNDAIAHEDRRDLRGGRLVAAWLDHFDAREQNSMDSWIASDTNVNDSSPGYVRHYYLDTSDVFGSEWAWDAVSRRLSRSYLLDWGDIGQDFITLGIPLRPWDRVERTPGMEMFGYFPSPEFDPEGWKNEYPNPAFSRATERDNAWMARILSRFDREDIRALAELGKFSDPRVTEFLAEVLQKRLEKIAERYLLRLSPIADVRVTSPASICATDLARRRHVRPDASFRYAARWRNGARTQAVGVDVHDGGEICMTLPSASANAADADDAASRYVVLTIANAASTYPLRAHFYDLGARGGYRLVGIERHEETNEP
jgi:hypothetical protein